MVPVPRVVRWPEKGRRVGGHLDRVPCFGWPMEGRHVWQLKAVGLADFCCGKRGRGLSPIRQLNEASFGLGIRIWPTQTTSFRKRASEWVTRT